MKRFTLAVLTLGIFTVAQAEFAILDPYGKVGIGGVDANGNYKRILVGADGAILTSPGAGGLGSGSTVYAVGQSSAQQVGTYTVTPGTGVWLNSGSTVYSVGQSSVVPANNQPLYVAASSAVYVIGQTSVTFSGGIAQAGAWLVVPGSGSFSVAAATAMYVIGQTSVTIAAGIGQAGSWLVVPGSGSFSVAAATAVYIIGQTSATWTNAQPVTVSSGNVNVSSGTGVAAFTVQPDDSLVFMSSNTTGADTVVKASAGVLRAVVITLAGGTGSRFSLYDNSTTNHSASAILTFDDGVLQALTNINFGFKTGLVVSSTGAVTAANVSVFYK